MRRGTACIDCNCFHYETVSYMVNDELWGRARLSTTDTCCLDCLVRRIGRKLKLNDFTNAPINNKIRLVLRVVNSN